jgi:hypothetical protein
MIPKNIALWKMVWDFVMNDKSFRKKFTRGGEYTASEKKPMSEPHGTIYIGDSSDEGHFIAYEIVGGLLHIFDSAASQNRYGEWATQDVLEHLANRAKKPSYTMVTCHPQVHKEDSFCQTWSLAWLTKEFRPLVTQVTTEKSALNSLFTICQRIVHDERFVKFVTHKKDFQEHMDQCIKDVKLKRPAFDTPETFLKFSDEMTLEMFTRIFED